MLERARAYQARDDRVEIVDKKVDDHGVLAITSFYVRYLLPMMVEVQWWDFKGTRPRRPRRARVADAPLRFGAFAPQGWKLEYAGWDAADAWARTVELAQLAGAARLRAPLGVRPRRDRASPRAHPRVRGVHDARRAVAAHRAPSASASSSPAPRTATPACSPRRPPGST